MTISYLLNYSGKLDTPKCKQLVIELVNKLDAVELFNELAELDEDTVEQVRLKAILVNTKYWKRENKVLITQDEVDMFKRLLRIDIVIENTGYVRNFNNDELPGRATIYQINNNTVFIEMEVG